MSIPAMYMPYIRGIILVPILNDINLLCHDGSAHGLQKLILRQQLIVKYTVVRLAGAMLGTMRETTAAWEVRKK